MTEFGGNKKRPGKGRFGNLAANEMPERLNPS
jgi:hypothetical protein